MDCETCKKERAQETGPVPRWTHEADMARMERGNKRAWILNIILAVLLAGSWVFFWVYESQFVEEVITQEVDTGEGDAIVAGIGDINYGESQTNGKAADP